MADFSLGEADLIRRAMGKKKKKILDENKKRFVQAAVKKGYKTKVANQVWTFIEAFANYGFNKAHAASYAMIAYHTAYLKSNFPVEYMTALMSVESNSHSMNRDEKVAHAIDTCKKMGIKINPPDINLSNREFNIENDDKSLEKLSIRFGLSAIKNVGTAAIENILETRSAHKKFTSFTQFLIESDSRKVNKKVIESLIKVGAFDSFATRSSLLENLEDIRQKATQFDSDVEGQDSLFGALSPDSTKVQDNFPILSEYPQQELLSFEKELLGLYLTEHPLSDALIKVGARANIKIGELEIELHQNRSYLFGGIITKIREVTTKAKGKRMAFGTLQDKSGSIEFVIFPKTYEQYQDQLQLNTVVLLKAKVDNRDNEINLIAEKITVPDEALLSQTPDELKHEIFIPRKTNREVLQNLGKLLKSKPGKHKIIVLIPNGQQPKRMLLPYGVEWDKKLKQQVDDILNP